MATEDNPEPSGKPDEPAQPSARMRRLVRVLFGFSTLAMFDIGLLSDWHWSRAILTTAASSVIVLIGMRFAGGPGFWRLRVPAPAV